MFGSMENFNLMDALMDLWTEPERSRLVRRAIIPFLVYLVDAAESGKPN